MTKKITEDLSLLNLLFLTWKQLSRRRKRQVRFLFVLTILNSFTELVSVSSLLPYLAALINPNEFQKNILIIKINSFLGFNDNENIMISLTIVFLVAILVSAFIRYIFNLYTLKISSYISSDMSINLYKFSLYRPFSYYLSNNSNKLITAISKDINEITYYIFNPIFHLISSIIISLTLIIGLLFINFSITFYSIITIVVLYLFFYKKTAVSIKQISKRNTVLSQNLIKLVQESIGGIRDIIISNNQNFYINKYKTEDRILRKDVAFGNFLSLAPKLIIEPLGITILAFLGYFLVKGGNSKDALPFLGVLSFCGIRLLPFAQRIYEGITLPRLAKSRLINFLLLLQNPPDLKDKEFFIKPFHFNKEIKLQNISFRYDKGGDKILKKINLTINLGERIGIVGKTGSGKSTLLNIMMGLLEPSSGQILLDDSNLYKSNKNYLIKSWQKSFIHVPQEIYLSDSSLAENIAFGEIKKNIDYEKLYKAARKAQLLDFIKNTKNGFETHVGERGIRLSGGQKQRIGIARALYKESKIIFLDEATSALDMATERLIMDEFSSLSEDITLIIIAHRKNTLEICNKIYEINFGEIRIN